jgi:hypothetical protein
MTDGLTRDHLQKKTARRHLMHCLLSSPGFQRRPPSPTLIRRRATNKAAGVPAPAP